MKTEIPIQGILHFSKYILRYLFCSKAEELFLEALKHECTSKFHRYLWEWYSLNPSPKTLSGFRTGMGVCILKESQMILPGSFKSLGLTVFFGLKVSVLSFFLLFIFH